MSVNTKGTAYKSILRQSTNGKHARSKVRISNAQPDVDPIPIPRKLTYRNNLNRELASIFEHNKYSNSANNIRQIDEELKEIKYKANKNSIQRTQFNRQSANAKVNSTQGIITKEKELERRVLNNQASRNRNKSVAENIRRARELAAPSIEQEQYNKTLIEKYKKTDEYKQFIKEAKARLSSNYNKIREELLLNAQQYAAIHLEKQSTKKK
jgi:hypothetical protein